jgi:hypothetical protein
MNSTEILEVFREEMNDAVAPYLWSDALIYRYLDDAQKMFCRKTEGIEDSSTAEITRLEVVPATDWYATDRRILKVRKAYEVATGREIPIVNMEVAGKEGLRFDGRPGPMKALVTGLEKNKLRAWPMPSTAMLVDLSVFRLPLVTITDDGDQELEIDEQHHLSLLMWMKHKAYGKEDAETFNRRKSDDYEMRFLAYCVEARKEQERARRNTGTVMYGGI